MRLTKFELYKIWRDKLFLLALSALVILNLFLLWNGTKPTSGALTSHAYNTYNKLSANMTMDEKAEFLNSEFKQIEALNLIESVLREEAYAGHTEPRLRERYAEEFETYFEVYKLGNYIKYCDNIANEYKFINKIKIEFEEVYGYENFLDSIDEKANKLSAISIFAESADGYDMKNITKTAKAFEDMRGTSINYTPEKGLMTALDFSLTDVVGIFAMLLIATVLVRNERDNGLLNIIRSNPAGRYKTAFAKFFALAISLLFVYMLLYGVNLVYCHITYGLGDLTRTIQSVPSLMRSTLKLNVLQYIGLFFFTKWLAAIVAGAWVMLAMLIAHRAITGYALSLALLGINLFVRNLIPATSNLNVIKYANLVSLLRTNELLGGYRNLYFFKSPVLLVTVEAVFAVASFLLFTSAFCITFARKYFKASAPFVLPKFLQKVKEVKGTTPQKQEWHKLLVMNGVAVVLVLLIGYQTYQAVTTESYINADEIYYRHYIKNIEGKITQEKLDWLKEESKKFDPIFELQALLNARRISNEEYSSMMMAYSSLQQELNAYYKVINRASYYTQHKNSQFVYESGWLNLFDYHDKKDVADSLLFALITSICFAGYFAMERQSGMEKVIAATPLGREYTAKIKIRNSDVVCGVLTVLSVLPRLVVTLRDYGLHAWFAPVYSMQEYEKALDLPLIVCFIVLLVTRFLAIRLMSGITHVISHYTGNFIQTLFASSIVFAMPLLLSSSGLTIAKWASVYLQFHSTAMLKETDGIAIMLVVSAVFSLLIWCCNEYLKDNFGKAR